ncbi:amidohydrolase [Myxococcota bacterium]|nr:amidohydrolase [Myxococcota bacterium]
MENHQLYSCDDHLDLPNVPRDLWTNRLPSRMHELGPHVVERDGKHVWMAGGKMLGVSGKMEAHLTAISRLPGIEDDGFRASNPELRLQDMEHDGIHASIVYGAGALSGFPIHDPEVHREVLRAWNDWAAEEFNAYAPDRLSALPFLPTGSVDEAVREFEHCMEIGHRGAIINPFSVDLKNDDWDRLWAAVSSADVPISFHIGRGTSLSPYIIRERAPYSSIVPMQMDEPLALMIFMGALVRYPSMKLVLAESGIGWLPYFVGRMDDQFEKHCVPYDDCIKTRPSEIFARQIYSTFEEEPLGPSLIPLMGPDNFMWACDYPHVDSTWPDSHHAIEKSLGKLDESAIRKLTGETCQRLYKLP